MSNLNFMNVGRGLVDMWLEALGAEVMLFMFKSKLYGMKFMMVVFLS